MKILCVLTLFIVVGCAVNDNEHEIQTDCTITQVPTGYTIVHVGTVNHDGHKWVVSSEGGIVHHPDCSCHKVGEKP